MSNIKGLLKAKDLEDFKAFLTAKGVGFTIPKSPYAPLMVFTASGTAVCSIDSRQVVGVPESLRELVMEFYAKPAMYTDTQRLEFLLGASRKLVVERVFFEPDWQRFEIYVEIGVMGEDRATAVEMQIPTGSTLLDYSLALLDNKRAAIDLAIKEYS